MSTYSDLLAVLKYVGGRTGDPNAWLVGLTPDEVAAVVTPWTSSAQLDAIVAKIRQQHPDLFGSPAPATPGEPQQGAAAEAIATAEAALAHQNSANAQLDLQVISAILNAHASTVEGSEALKKLQQETEAAVRTRSDLDTPAGARDFQRFLIGKLRDIRAVVANASLDDTSKSALMAAWTSLYNASKTGPGVGDDRRPGPTVPDGAPARGASQRPATVAGGGGDPYLDPLLLDDPGLLAGDSPASDPTTGSSAPAMPMTPMMPSIPSLGAGSVPGGSMLPGSVPGLNSAGGLPLSRMLGGIGTEHEPTDIDEAQPAKDHASSDEPDAHKDDGEKEASGEKPERLPPAPTTVTLPDGETVTAASPQIAAAIKAAVGGASIADAFRQQGITIPPPGTAVTNPVDLARLTPGDVGMFTDRHALALGHSKALLDGQIQHISTVSGPSFLGWEHPPAAPAATVPGTAPAQTERPTPTRPAAASVESTTAQ
jgi:Domain of unknown function (DUF4226)